MKKITQYIPKKLQNRWVLAPLILFMWLLFFEDISIISLIKTKFKIKELQKEWTYKEEKIQAVKAKKALILQDVEKYARETYWMKKPNEELFILEESVED